MKKIIVILLLAIVSGMTLAQESGDPKLYYVGLEHENILKVKGGYGWQVDPYMSPLEYRGHEIGLGNEWWQPFSKARMHQRKRVTYGWEHVGRVDANAYKMYNTSMTNYYLGAEGIVGWGAYHKWRIDNKNGKVKTNIILGPYIEASAGVRQQASEVNKPYSVDLALDAQVMAGLSISFYAKKTSYRLRYLARTNLIGMDVMPEYWQSYYEITESVMPMMRFSHPGNRNVLRHELTMDFQFNRSTWRMGAEHVISNYRNDNMQWNRQEIRVIVGCIWKYKTEGGKKL